LSSGLKVEEDVEYEDNFNTTCFFSTKKYRGRIVVHGLDMESKEGIIFKIDLRRTIDDAMIEMDQKRMLLF